MNEEGQPTTSAGRTTRRTILGGIAAGVGVALVGPAKQATAAGSVVTAAPLAGRTSVATSGKSVVQVPTLLGAELKVTERAVRAGSTVTVAFDGRLYRLNSPVLTTSTGRNIPCRLTQAPKSSSSGSTAATLTLDQALDPGETYVLSLGTRRLVRYPDDIIAAPLPIQVAVADQIARPVNRKLAASPEAEHPVWGLSVGVGWQAVFWAEGFHSWIPEIITVASTGPADVPAGTLVSATLDARVFSSAQLQPLVGGALPGPNARPVDGVLRAQWALPRALPVGERVSARLVANTIVLDGPLIDLHPPTVTARAADATIGQRTTGQESTSREDSAYNVETRLTFGLDLATPLKPR